MDLAKKVPSLVAIGPKDKENLSSPGVILKNKKSPKNLKTLKRSLKNNSKECNKNMEMIRNSINNINSENLVTKKPVTAEDLTTKGNPGDSYWEQLSESRRVALEATWKENSLLHSRVLELEYENTRLKSTLEEAKNSIRLLTELLEEQDDDEEFFDEEGHDDESSDEPFPDLDESAASVSSL